VVGPGAALVHHKVQREDTAAYHLAAVAAAQAADSQLGSHAVALGAALSRTAIATRFDAPGAACAFDGLYIADGTQHVDHHTTIDHAKPHCNSWELFNGVYDEKAMAELPDLFKNVPQPLRTFMLDYLKAHGKVRP